MRAAAWLSVAAWPGMDAIAQNAAAERESIHWAYAAYFGTGHYTIGDLEDVYALRVPLRRDVRPASMTEDSRSVGITLRVPVTIGLHDFHTDDMVGMNEMPPRRRLDRVGTFSAVPGVEIEIPITERWSIKPLAHLGWGTDFDGDASAWIYWAGMRSRLSFAAREVDWALVNALTYVGYKPRGDASGRIVPLLTGLEFRRPLENSRIGGERVQLHWHVAYTRYLSDLRFDAALRGIARIDVASEWEAGVAFGKETTRLRLWRLSWDRVGLAYQFSGDGDFTGIKLVFRSLFHR